MIRHESKMEKLLDNSLVSFYWIGFILADGSFGYYIKNYKGIRFTFVLAEKDKNQVEKISLFLNIPLRKVKNGYGIHKVQNDIMFKIMKKFDMKLNKSLNPPNTSKYNGFSLCRKIALIIGYIDGDGCLKNRSKSKHNSKDTSLTIKNHASWISFDNWVLENIEKFVGYDKRLGELKKTIINSFGYCSLNINRNAVLVKLKKFAEKHKLPIMERKWNKIIDYENKEERSYRLGMIFYDLYKKYPKNKTVFFSKKMGITCDEVNRIRRRLSLNKKALK